MIQEVKSYACDGTPTDEDVIEALEIATQNNCMIRLYFSVPYHGTHCIFIAHDSTPDSIKKQIQQIDNFEEG